MNCKTKFLMPVLLVGTLCATSFSALAQEQTKQPGNEVILFKIHNIVPEKDVNGKVLYCNIGATFFNRTPTDLVSASLTLLWDDDVIGETIDLEERADRETLRANPKANVSRYPTSSLTSREIKSSVKLPPIKSNQQVTLKTKVDTDRCFLLLNDMDIAVNSCVSAETANEKSKDCGGLFRYVSPKSAEYYQDFKEISYEKQLETEDAAFDMTRKEIEKIYEETSEAIRSLCDESNLQAQTDTSSSETQD